jgi:transposase
VGEFGCGSVTSCWRRLAEWAAAGVFERLQEALLDELGDTDQLDWSRVTPLGGTTLAQTQSTGPSADPSCT